MSRFIQWEGKRPSKKNGRLAALGVQSMPGSDVKADWAIRKSLTGMNYQLFLGSSCNSVKTGATIDELKQYAQSFF